MATVTDASESISADVIEETINYPIIIGIAGAIVALGICSVFVVQRIARNNNEKDDAARVLERNERREKMGLVQLELIPSSEVTIVAGTGDKV